LCNSIRNFHRSVYAKFVRHYSKLSHPHHMCNFYQVKEKWKSKVCVGYCLVSPYIIPHAHVNCSHTYLQQKGTKQSTKDSLIIKHCIYFEGLLLQT